MTIDNVLGMQGLVGIVAKVVVVALWFTLTVGILCVMEVSDRFLSVHCGGGRIRDGVQRWPLLDYEAIVGACLFPKGLFVLSLHLAYDGVYSLSLLHQC